jgi:hypothetical protein
MGTGVHKWRVLAISVTAVIVSAPLGWFVSDQLEHDNDFCTACHFAPGRRLHGEIRRGFDAEPPANLAAAHGRVRVRSRVGVSARAPAGGVRGEVAPGAARDPAAFRCIDCHGGTSPIGRLRVKALAAKDLFWYVVGDFEEPTHMRWPLWDEDCLECHSAFDETPVEAWQSPRFHQLPLHNAALGVDCVECHRVHEVGGNPEADFLHAPLVRAQCARCHPKFEEGMG